MADNPSPWRKPADAAETFETTPITRSACPYCGYFLDLAMSAGQAARPKPGDFSICVMCAGLAAFDNSLALTALDEVEIAIALTHSEIRHAVALVREGIKKKWRPSKSGS